MEITYTCRGLIGDKECSWPGTMRFISLTLPYEAVLTVNGSAFHLIVGAYAQGHYLCIPNWSIGIELASLSDHFWNQEQLCRVGLSDVDVYSISAAIAEMEKYA